MIPTKQTQERVDELVAGEAFGMRIELRAVADLDEEVLGIGGRHAEHGDAAFRRLQ